ncbi:MAG: hypothetical protein ACOCXM_09570 [Myxococcota bacterium]
MRTAKSTLGLVPALLLAASCGKSTPTQIVLLVDADTEVRQRTDQLRVTLRGSGGGDPTESVLVYGDDEAVGFPRPISTIPEGGDADRSLEAAVEAVESSGSMPFVTARVNADYVEGEAILVRVTLTASCIDVSCDASQTCFEGSCLDAEDAWPTEPFDPDAIGGEGQPNAQIHFPVAGLTDAPSITVRGVATDPDGDAIAAVMVNGEEATIADDSGDGVEWSHEIELRPGVNAITIAVEDETGAARSEADTVRVTRDVLWTSPSHVALDERGHAYVSDGAPPPLRAVYEVNLQTGERRLVSGRGRGTGPADFAPDHLAYDLDAEELIVADTVADAILQIDPSTGNRSALTSNGTAPGPTISAPRWLLMDRSNDRLLYIDGDPGEVIAVDIATGNRSSLAAPNLTNLCCLAEGPSSSEVLAMTGSFFNGYRLVQITLDSGDVTTLSEDGEVGTGQPFVLPRSAVTPPVADVAYTIDEDLEAVMQADLDNGNRSIVSGAGVGSGPELEFPQDIAYDRLDQRLLVADRTGNTLMSVDPGTGERTVVSGVLRGTGIRFRWERGAMLDREGERLVYADRTQEAIVSVSIGSGDRTVLADADTGSGPSFTDPEDVAAHPSGDSVYFTADQGVFTLDPASGTRELISGGTVGEGVALEVPDALAVDPSTGQLLVVEAEMDQIIGVDPETGDRTLVSGAGFGEGPAFVQLGYTIFDTEGDRLLVLDPGIPALLAVDLDSGNRTTLSDATTGGGEIDLDDNGVGLAFAPEGDAVYVIDRLEDAVIRIDLDTGNRSLVSGGARLRAPEPSVGLGPAVHMGEALATDVEREVLYISAQGATAVDLRTGDRIIVSR